jgi:hypothetical protein
MERELYTCKLEVIVYLYAPAAVPPKEEVTYTKWIGDWVRHTAGLDDVEKTTLFILPGIELRFPC